MKRRIRVLVCLTAAQLGLAGWAVHGALAEVREQLASIGESALGWAAGEDATHRQRVVINGLPLDVESSTRAQSVQAVLDRARRECQRSFQPTWQALWEGTVLGSPLIYPVGAPPQAIAPVLAHSGEHSGYVACLELPPPLQREDLGTWAGRFIAGGVLRVPGTVRYTMVRRAAKGSSVVSLVTRGALRPVELLGAGGDVPHPALPLPRPAGSRVSLHAASDAMGPSIVAFELADDDRRRSASDALQRYAAELRGHGFATTGPTGNDGGAQWTRATDGLGQRYFISIDPAAAQVVVVR